MTRITLKVNRDSPDWNAIASTASGVVLLPQGVLSRIPAQGQAWPPVSKLPQRAAALPLRTGRYCTVSRAIWRWSTTAHPHQRSSHSRERLGSHDHRISDCSQ
uniref:Uncharacterized protein n=1 Tax=Desertifilum tharense IPPAS B-1220 TaxID=1781255 RepID=A0ACD5GSL9_9CYAN